MKSRKGVRLGGYLAEPCPGAPVFLENDTNVIAHSERHAHLHGVHDALIVKASTGLGAGIVAGGRLQRGAGGASGRCWPVPSPCSTRRSSSSAAT